MDLIVDFPNRSSSPLTPAPSSPLTSSTQQRRRRRRRRRSYQEQRRVTFSEHSQIKVINYFYLTQQQDLNDCDCQDGERCYEQYKNKLWFSPAEERSHRVRTALLQKVLSKMTPRQHASLSDHDKRVLFTGMENYLVQEKCCYSNNGDNNDSNSKKNITTSIRHTIKEHRRRLLHAIQTEQNRQMEESAQWSSGRCDASTSATTRSSSPSSSHSICIIIRNPERLREISEELTFWSRESARAIGMMHSIL